MPDDPRAGQVPKLDPAAVRAFAAAFDGEVLDPGTPGYEAAAVVHQQRATAAPRLIVRPARAAAVADAIAFARAHGLEIAVRAGGHSAAGHGTGDGVLVIDMRGMAAVRVDPEARRARAEGGTLAGALVRAAGEHGMTVALGDNATVGIAGITLGGGVGYLSRAHGLTIDSLLAVELVTADGRVVTASATSEPELFWALRGGGGNFGVVTALEYRMIPAGMVYGGALVLPATRDVLVSVARLADNAPRELGVLVNVMPAPPAPFVPAEAIGKPAVMVVGVYNGDAAAGAAAWAPFRALATPIADTVGPLPYPAIYRFSEAASRPMTTADRSTFVDVLDDDVAGFLLDAFALSPGVQTIIQLRVLGGAVADTPADATAYGHRDARLLVVAIAAAATPDGAAAVIAWADAVLAGLQPRGTGVYVSFLEDEGDARIRAAYPADTLSRLSRVKAAWDPDNVFHHNQNIAPSVSGIGVG
ncbi:MAG: FAD-binding protein [Chloroflexota bacterium]